MKIRTLIVDDESLARKLIRRLLGEEEGIEIVGECADGLEAISMIAELSPNLVFLDIQMPECDGFAVLEQLASVRLPVIIFVTAYDAFALKAFEAHALDYLLKPIDEDRFAQTVERARIYLSGREYGAAQEGLRDLMDEVGRARKTISRLAVKSAGRMVFLRVEEIDWIGAEGNYLSLHVGKECHLLRGRLSELEKKLSARQFFRIHRSTIVNLDRVKEIQSLFKGEGVAFLKDGSRLPVSRTCSRKLQESLEARL